MVSSRPTRAIATALLLTVLVAAALYLLLGLGFHLAWKNARAACREARAARGEFVEPEVLAEPLALLFDVTAWPVYAWANLYHDGTPLATPCTH